MQAQISDQSGLKEGHACSGKQLGQHEKPEALTEAKATCSSTQLTNTETKSGNTFEHTKSGTCQKEPRVFDFTAQLASQEEEPLKKKREPSQDQVQIA